MSDSDYIGGARQALRGLGEMLFENVVNELRGVPHVHLYEDPRPVCADGLDAQDQRFGDLADALAAAEQAQDLILTIRETNVGCLAGRIAVAQRRDELLGGGRAQVPPPLRQPLNGVDQLLWRGPLARVSRRSGAKRTHRELFVGVNAENEDGKVRTQ